MKKAANSPSNEPNGCVAIQHSTPLICRGIPKVCEPWGTVSVAAGARRAQIPSAVSCRLLPTLPQRAPCPLLAYFAFNLRDSIAGCCPGATSPNCISQAPGQTNHSSRAQNSRPRAIAPHPCGVISAPALHPKLPATYLPCEIRCHRMLSTSSGIGAALGFDGPTSSASSTNLMVCCEGIQGVSSHNLSDR